MNEIFRKNAEELKNKVFKSAKAGSVYSLKFQDRDVEIYPGIYSHSNEYRCFLDKVQKELNSSFPVSTSHDGYYLSAPITSDFSKLRTLAGSIRPLTYSQSRLASEDKTKNRVLKMIYKITDLYYQGPIVVDHPRVSSMSSSGAPFFTHRAEDKLQHLSFVSSKINFLKEKFVERDLKTLREQLGVVLLSTAQIRRQSDSWTSGLPKKRAYVSYLASYGFEPIRDYRRSEVLNSDFGIELATCRTRVVNAYSSLVNNILTSIIAPLRDSAEKRCEFTWKHRTQKEKLDKMKKFPYMVGLDVKQFDNNVTFDALKEWINHLPVDDVFKDLALTFSLSPFYSAECTYCDGDVDNIDSFKYWRGLPSGIAFTSCFGKIFMVSNILAAYEDHIDRDLSPSEVCDILEGRGPIGILNMGDDSVVMGQKKDVESILVKLNDYLVVEKEEAITFLGDILYKDRNTLKMAHSLESYLVNWFVAERSISSKLRPFAMYGAQERRTIFRDNPLFEDVDRVVKDVFKFYFKVDRDYLEAKYMELPSSSGIVVNSAADLEVLTNYEKLYYKFVDDDSVSESIRAVYETRIPNDVLTTIRQAFNFSPKDIK